MSKRKVKLTLAAASVLASAVLAEGISRLTYAPVLDLSGTPPWEEQAFTPPLNEEGFREEPVGELPEGTRRVLVLGDSFTFGHGVGDGSKRFTDRVEARWNAEAASAGTSRVHLYNAGIPGSNPIHWVQVLPGMLRRYRPDAVLAVFFLRDGTDVDTSISFYRYKIEELRRKHSFGALDRLTLVRRLADRRIARDFSDWYQHQLRMGYLGEEVRTERWREVQGALLRLRSLCADRGIPFRMAIFPLLLDLDDYGFHDVEAEIERFADQAGIQWFSLTPAFLGRDASELWVSSVDQHPNEEGHRIAAEALYTRVRTLLGK